MYKYPSVGTRIGDYADYHRPIAALPILLNDDGVTYSPITGMEPGLSKSFEVNAGILKYLNGGRLFLINGTSDLEVDKAADITYALFINGEAVPTELTTVSFSASAKKANISITAVVAVGKDDVLEIRVKGDGTAAVTVTINKLDLTLVELTA